MFEVGYKLHYRGVSNKAYAIYYSEPCTIKVGFGGLDTKVRGYTNRSRGFVEYRGLIASSMGGAGLNKSQATIGGALGGLPPPPPPTRGKAEEEV